MPTLHAAEAKADELLNVSLKYLITDRTILFIHILILSSENITVLLHHPM